MVVTMGLDGRKIGMIGGNMGLDGRWQGYAW